jgi:hypothetical protein
VRDPRARRARGGGTALRGLIGLTPRRVRVAAMPAFLAPPPAARAARPSPLLASGAPVARRLHVTGSASGGGEPAARAGE